MLARLALRGLLALPVNRGSEPRVPQDLRVRMDSMVRAESLAPLALLVLRAPQARASLGQLVLAVQAQRALLVLRAQRVLVVLRVKTD